MSEFLLEFYSEEIPSKLQSFATKHIQSFFEKHLKEGDITFSAIQTFSTPHRIGCFIQGLPLEKPAKKEEKRGPKEGAAEQAIQGFLASIGKKIEECTWRKTPKGTYLFAICQSHGQKTETLLSALISKLASEFPWPKSMIWHDYGFRWIRPLHHVLALFNGKKIEGKIDLLSASKARLSFTDQTKGHRFLAPNYFSVSHFESYQKELQKQFVILDPQIRKAAIKKQIEALASKHALDWIEDEGLLNEVTGLVEWPNALLGKINSKFMDLPKELLQISMRSHQKYFSLKDKQGNFAPYFITIANIKTPNDAVITAGNERVLSARLADGLFFFTQDKKEDFKASREKLKTLTFHQKLGSLYQKTARVRKLAGTNKDLMEAATHYKNDLTSQMVNEFSDLQGIMGAYYAADAGLAETIQHAIYNQYRPAGPNDRIADKTIAAWLGVLDRIDTLVGFFGADLKPTSSKDPFALRRAALGVIRLILERNLIEVDLMDLIKKSFKTYQEQGIKLNINTRLDLQKFIEQRLYIYLKDQKIPYDILDSLTNSSLDICHFVKKVKALQKFSEINHLACAYKRLNNFLQAETKKGLSINHCKIDTTLLIEKAERQLHAAQNAIDMETTLQSGQFKEALQTLSALSEKVDYFLDNTLINAGDNTMKINRYALMNASLKHYQTYANFSKIQ